MSPPSPAQPRDLDPSRHHGAAQAQQIPRRPRAEKPKSELESTTPAELVSAFVTKPRIIKFLEGVAVWREHIANPDNEHTKPETGIFGQVGGCLLSAEQCAFRKGQAVQAKGVAVRHQSAQDHRGGDGTQGLCPIVQGHPRPGARQALWHRVRDLRSGLTKAALFTRVVRGSEVHVLFHCVPPPELNPGHKASCSLSYSCCVNGAVSPAHVDAPGPHRIKY